MSVENLKQTHLFVSGKEGYHTYRIPAMVVSTKGTLLAFCEGRKYSSRDFGDIDIVLRRRFDSGKTWQPMQIIMDDGLNTIGNPSPVVDQDTGTTWLLFTKNNMQVYVMNSVDDGATWSSPREVTEDLKSERWVRYGTGPCHGIQLKGGRLVTPCWRQVNYYIHYSEIVYSDDHGDTWTVGGTVGPYMDECTVVQTHDGSLYLNMRNYAQSRAYSRSRDEGITWSDVKFDRTLTGPVCQASVVRFTDEDSHGRNRVLFSNPAYRERAKMTIRLSYDECETWEVSKRLYRGSSAYSDIAVSPDMTICCIYERGMRNPYEKITFANFNIEWLTDGADRL
jgi:sialidase-1